ncbi:MAG: hypothetical protein U0457_00525 [Candidatus Sericytochromatia bacterium]
MNLDGSNKTQLTFIQNIIPNALGSNGYNYGLKLSPDGTKIAFNGGENLYTINTDGSDLRKITNFTYSYYGDQNAEHFLYFTWSSLDNKLAYGTTQHDGYYSEKARVYTINQDGSENVEFFNENTHIGQIKPDWGIKSVKNSSKNEINLSW